MAAPLAAGSDDFASSTETLARLWAGLKPSDVFRCDVLTQAQNSLTWILDLSFGGIAGGGNAHSLLDASPLKHFLAAHLDCEPDRGQHQAAATCTPWPMSATNYNSGKSYLFIQGKKGHPMWNRSRRVTLATKITVDHICASAAIPLVFRPVKLETAQGTAFFGDGCIRLQQPLSPVVRLGAQRIVAIGARCESWSTRKRPPITEILPWRRSWGCLFNVMFLDHLATDIEHLERLNQLLSNGQIGQPGAEACDKMRPLKMLLLTPSVDLSHLAEVHQKDMPYLIQYFVNSLGRDAASCADLMSYLLFTSKYTKELIEIGYGDADKRIDEIESFLYPASR